MSDSDLRLPWHRETIGHANVEQIGHKVLHDLLVLLPDGLPPNTDATWIVNADNKIVAFVGNGPRQTENADAIIAAVAARQAAEQQVAVLVELRRDMHAHREQRAARYVPAAARPAALADLPAAAREHDQRIAEEALLVLGDHEGNGCCDPKTLEHVGQSIRALLDKEGATDGR